MDFNKFTVKLQEAVETANTYAGECSHSQLEIAHILLALLEQKEGMTKPLIDKIGVSSSAFESELRRIIDSLPKAYGPVQRSLSQHAYKPSGKKRLERVCEATAPFASLFNIIKIFVPVHKASGPRILS